MEDIAALAEDIYRRRVLQARITPALDRMWEGPQLFEMACEISYAGAVNSVGAAGADAEFARRMAIADRLRERE